MRGRSDIKPTLEKHCAECGQTFNRKRFPSGRLEDFQAFNRRLFCSLSCANSQSKGGDSRTRWHARAQKHRASRCESCTSTLDLHVHHCDENWKNNSPDNLQTLCKSCHRSWHLTQRAAGVKPAGRKPVLPVSLLQTVPNPEWDDCAPTVTRSTRKRQPSSSAQHAKQSNNE